MLERMFRWVPWATASGLALFFFLEPALAASGTGQSLPGQMGMQEAVTPIAREIQEVYDFVNIVIIAIALFVLVLMAYVMVRFRESNNPTPTTTTHNTFLEVAWTVIPIFILVAIAIPSFKLLINQYTYPKADITIKAIGNAWFWEHEYPDHGNFVVTSNVLNDADIAERVEKGLPAPPRLLGVDNEIVVPVNKVVHVLITSNDVIHNWTIPSFGSKIDAVPGRVTSTWFQAEKEGVYYGQCSELCGLNHAFMPIAVRVVGDAIFSEWAAAMQAKDKKKARKILEGVALEQAGVKKFAAAKGQTAN
jgi:cytochrome c oxidase subunit II